MPGDKSISHRAVLLGAIGEGETRITGFGRSGRHRGDRRRDARARRRRRGGRARRARRARRRPARPRRRHRRLRERRHADAAARRHPRRAVRAVTTLTGDESLSQRPMERIAEPLRQLGAQVATTNGHAPLIDRGLGVAEGHHVRAARRERAGEVGGAPRGPVRNGPDDGRRADADARPHRADARERRHRGAARADLDHRASRRRRSGSARWPCRATSPRPRRSSRLRRSCPGSDLTVHDVGLNPRRTGFLDVLERMGAHLAVFNRHRVGREQVGDVQIQYSELERGRGEGRRGAEPRRRAAARRAARLACARQEHRPRRGRSSA